MPGIALTVRRWLSRVAAAGADLIYPPQCVFCRTDIGTLNTAAGGFGAGDGIFLCASCRKELVRPRSACMRCGAAVAENLFAADKADAAVDVVVSAKVTESCRSCRNAQFAFERAVALGDYRDELREAVLRMKRPADEPLATTLGRLLAREHRATLLQFEPTTIVAIPMHWTRRIARGTNSPELLAAAIGREMGAHVAWQGLVRRRRTVHQNELLAEDRAGNVDGAFRVGLARRFRGQRVLLVDDVLTTGSTASEAAKVVRRAEAIAVAVAVVARADSPGRT